MNRHLLSEEISAWMIGEREADALRHVADCAQCRGEIDRLEHALLQFRDSGRRWSDHCYSVREPRPAAAAWPWRRLAAAGGLVAAILVGILLVRPAPAVRRPEPFLPIPYVAPLAPYERATLSRIDVPVTALLAAGFELHGAESGSVMTVDVLVGQDGRARAIRPIYRSVKQ